MNHSSSFKKSIRGFFTFLVLILVQQISSEFSIYFNSYHKKIGMRSWKDIRDQNIVKQTMIFLAVLHRLQTFSMVITTKK